MEYNENGPGAADMNAELGKKAGLPMNKKKVWLWVLLAVIFVCAVTVTVAAALGFIGGGEEKQSGLKGNAGVAAAYAFFSEQQDRQKDLISGTAKEIGEKLLNGPFEIESELQMGTDGFGISGIPLSNVAIGIDAKYDLKDLGVKVSALGMDVFGGYVIDNNIVADVMGRAGSKTIEQADAEKLKGEMGLKNRLFAFLPFLPKNDDVFMGVLQAVASSVPDKYTTTDKQDVYSPKDDKDVKMDVITTTLDAAAIKEVVGNLEAQLKGDKKLSGDIQDIIDGFTGFMGLDAVTLDDAFKSISDTVGSDDLKDINMSWSVYMRGNDYVGIHVVCTGDDINMDYTLMSEYSGNDSYNFTNMDVNGTKSKSTLHSSWKGDKVTMEGSTTSDSGYGGGEMTEEISGTLEFAKNGGDEYSITGDMSAKVDASGILDSMNNVSVDVGIEADIKTGGNLGTLKETRGWNDIYDEKWGSLEDLFKSFGSGLGMFGLDPGNNL